MTVILSKNLSFLNIQQPLFTGAFSSDLELIKQEITLNSDVYFREFNIGYTCTRAAIVFVEGLADKDLIDTHIMKSLMLELSEEYKQEQAIMKGTVLKEFIKHHILSISQIKEVHNIKDLLSEVLTGSTALLIDGSPDILILGTTKGKKQEPLRSLYQSL
ncbi:hypothetical protein GCM10020331_085680 [Ectobacillus funiculus]